METAKVLGMSERGVCELERRAFGKLRNDGLLHRFRKEYNH